MKLLRDAAPDLCGVTFGATPPVFHPAETAAYKQWVRDHGDIVDHAVAGIHQAAPEWSGPLHYFCWLVAALTVVGGRN
jgi:hypothetical protein